MTTRKNKTTFIGGTTSEARKKYFNYDKELTQVVTNLATSYGISPALVIDRLAHEGIIDRLINDHNAHIQRGGEERPSRAFSANIFNSPYSLFGLDYIFDTYTKGVTKTKRPINFRRMPAHNESGERVNSGDTNNIYDTLELFTAELASRREQVKKQYPNLTDAELDSATAARYNASNKYFKQLMDSGEYKTEYPINVEGINIPTPTKTDSKYIQDQVQNINKNTILRDFKDYHFIGNDRRYLIDESVFTVGNKSYNPGLFIDEGNREFKSDSSLVDRFIDNYINKNFTHPDKVQVVQEYKYGGRRKARLGLEENNVPTQEEYIAQQIAAKRAAALDKSRNRTSVRVPMIPNTETEEAWRNRINNYIKYQEELLSSIMANYDNYKKQLGIHYIQQEQEALDKFLEEKDKGYPKLVPGANCMYNAGDCYGLNIPGNQTFVAKHEELGFKKAPKGSMEPGDIVQDVRGGTPIHAMIYDSKDNEGNLLFNYAKGRTNDSAFDINQNYVKQGKYTIPIKDYDVYKFVGTPADSTQWINEYKQRYANAMRYGGRRKAQFGLEKNDNTSVAPIYREQVFIPAIGTTLMKQNARPKVGGIPVASGAIEIVSPEFDLLTGVRGLINMVKPNKVSANIGNGSNMTMFDGATTTNEAIKQGIREARDYVRDPVIVETVERNKELLERISAKPARNMGWFTDGNRVAANTRAEVLQHYVDRPVHVQTSNDLAKGFLGDYTSANTRIRVKSGLSPYDTKRVAFHEGLHHSGYGNFDGVLYDLKAEKLFGIDDYLVGHEAAVNTAELGRIMGLELGQKYPGLQAFKDMIAKYNVAGFDKKFIFDKAILNTPRDYKRLWDALTGKYFTTAGVAATGLNLTNDDEMKCGGRRKAQLGLDIREGGIAIPIAPNMYYMDGRSHDNGGIAIGPNNKNGLEVEGGEVVKIGKNDVKVFSSVPLLRGVSPAQLVMQGVNPNTVFKAQEEFKDRNRINDDGTRYEVGGEKRIYTPSKSIQRQIQETGKITIGGAPTIGGLRTAKYVKGLANVKSYAKQTNKIFTKANNFVNNSLQGLINKHKITPNQADAYKKFYDEIVGVNGVNIPKTASFFLNNDNREMKFGGNMIYEINGNVKNGLMSVRPKAKYGARKKFVNGGDEEVKEKIINANTKIGEDGLIYTKSIDGDWYTDGTRYEDSKYYMGRPSAQSYSRKKIKPKTQPESLDEVVVTAEAPIQYKYDNDGDIYFIKNERKVYVRDEEGNFVNAVNDKESAKRILGREIPFRFNSKEGRHEIYNIDENKWELTTYDPDKYIKTTEIEGVQANYPDDKSDKSNYKSFTYKKDKNGKFVKVYTDTKTDNAYVRPNREGANYKPSPYNPLTGEKVNNDGIVETPEPSVKGTTKVSGQPTSTPRKGGTQSTASSRGTAKVESPKPATATNPMEARYASRVQKGQAQEVTTQPVVEYNEAADKNPDKNRYTRATGFKAGEAPASPGNNQKAKDDEKDKDGRWIGQYKTTNVGDWIGLGSNLAGSIASYFMTKNAINKMPDPIKPVMAPATKLKTKYNVEPQLTGIREAEQMNRAAVRRNTQSSNTSLAREQRLMNEARGARNTLYGQKENIETQLINQDRLNRQSVMRDNVKTYNDYLNRLIGTRQAQNQLRISNINNLISGLTGSVNNILGTIESRRATNNTIRAMAAANPNVDARLIGGFDYYIDPITKKKYNKNQQYVGTING